MTGKSKIRKSNRQTRRKKFSLSKLFMILIVIAMSVAFLIFSVYTPFKKKIPQRSSTSVTKTGPSFRKDGTLSIVTSNPTSKIMLDIEIADDEGERMRGLMDRLNLPENAGMLFIFNNDEPRSFWMKNTFIPLDIIFINSNKEIVSIQKDTQPKTTTPIPSDFPARYVLEVNTGFTDRYNIKPGDVIDFSH